jgi:acyl dehydratase
VAETILYGETGLREAVGMHLGYSSWLDISRDRLELFARATGDTNATYLAISLSNMFLPQIVEVQGFAMGINYGTDSVRFPSPLLAGTSVRGGASLLDVVDVRDGVQTRMLITIEHRAVERDAGDPVCVIESISRWLR